MVTSQVIRLLQHDPGAWIVCDYAGRLGALLVLAAFPSARSLAFRFDARAIPWWEAALWIMGSILVVRVAGNWLADVGALALPASAIGSYPALHGRLYVVDLVFGLMLVAFSEEILFRRCALAAVRGRLGEGWRMIGLTSAVFAAYHWWSGIGNMGAALLFGVYAMLLYRRCRAIWPVVIAHYLYDIVSFS